MTFLTTGALALAAFAVAETATAQDAGTPPPAWDESAVAPADIRCTPEPNGYILPTTGALFTLPPDPEADRSCELEAPSPLRRPPAPNLFSMVAVPIGSAPPSAKWNAARLSSLADEPGPWDELVSEVRRLPAADPVRMVNQWVNWHVRYRDDAAGDEWSPALHTLRRAYGDCEDFALAKMGLLLALGVPADDMYLVLLHDSRKIEHAVLAVSRHGRLLVLDNRTDKVLGQEAIADYTPILSFSGPFAWTYGARGG